MKWEREMDLDSQNERHRLDVVKDILERHWEQEIVMVESW